MFQSDKVSTPSELYQTLFDHAADPILVLGMDGKFIEANQAACRHLGYRREEILQMGPPDIDDAASAEKVPERIAHILREGEGTFEAVHIHRDGSHIPVEMHIRMVEFNNQPFFINVCRDINERKQREIEYRAMVQAASDGFWVASAKDARFLEVNDTYCNTVGYSREELLSMHIFDIEAIESPEETESHIKTIMKSGHDIFETRHRHKDGHLIDIEVSASYADLSGGIFYVFTRDISTRKKTDTALCNSERELRNIFNSLQEAYYRTDIEGRVVKVSPSAGTLMACEPDELIGKVIAQYYVHESGREKFVQELHEGHGSVSNYEAEIRREDGEIIWVSTNAHYFRDEHGNVTGVEGTIRDVTEQKQQDEQLQLAKFVLDNAPLNITYLDSEARIRYINKTGCETLGYTQDELLQLSIPDIDPLFPMQVWDEHWQDLKQNKSVPVETLHRRKNGEEFPIEVIANYIEFGDKAYNVAFDRDITESKQQQELLKASQKRFSMLFDSSSDGLFIINMQGDFIDINKTAHERLGYAKDEMMAMKLTELDPPEFAARVPERLALILEQGTATFETAHYRKDGSIMPVEINARIIELNDEKVFFSVVRDISERKKLEEQLRQSQKMEAVGTLVGGIAHDFNNMLAAIQGNLYLARKQLRDHPVADSKLENIEKLGTRAADMVHQLLTFARKDSVSMQIFSLNAFMKEGYKLATAGIPENIDHQTSVCNEELRIKGDITQLQQVLMNLLNNAVDAVSANPLPKIRCSLTPFESDKAFKAKHPELAGDLFACISIKDNGHGIPADKLAKIFEPFFTTKEVGKGTGLGLAMLYGAIQTHGGLVDVQSEVNKGTLFSVYLPLNIDEPEAKPELPETASNGIGETILLVDDEEELRSTTGEVLTKMGYQILEAADGEEALNIFKARREHIDLIISDIIMPRMGGSSLLKAIRQLDETVPVILVTGYDKDNVLDKGTQTLGCLVLNKPFNFDTLSRTIQSMIRIK